MSYQNKGETTAVVTVTSEGRGGNFTFAAGADPAVAIEAAWSYLNTLGGGTLVTKGAGETWTVQSQIDSQGDNVHWMSDWSLVIEAQGGLNTHVIELTDDRIVLEGLHIDGNHETGEWGAGEYYCIQLWGSSNTKILRCRIKEAHNYGIFTRGTSEHVEIANCWFHNCCWNNVSLGAYSSYYDIHDNLIEETSGIGLAITNVDYYGAYFNIHDNIVRNVIYDESPANAGWGIAIEGLADYVKICDNIIENCRGAGIVASDSSYTKKAPLISNNILENCGNDQAGTIFAAGIFAAVTEGMIIEGNVIMDCGVNNGYGIYLHPAELENTDYAVRDNTIRVQSGTTITTKFYGIYTGGGNGDVNNTLIVMEPSGANQIGIYISATSDSLVKGNSLRDIEDNGIYMAGNADNNYIAENYFENVGTGLNISAGTVDDTFVHSNDFYGCTTDVSNSGTGTTWGSNRDQNGNFDQGVEP